MSAMAVRIFGGSRCTLNRRMQVFDNVQARCKSKLARPEALGRNIYKEKREAIGFFGYCLLSVPIATFALGIWQIKRRKWKLDVLEKLKKRTSAEPIDIPSVLGELDDKEFRQLRAKGKFLYEKEFLVGPRSLIINGKALSEQTGGLISGGTNTGYYVITPFKLDDQDTTILVNRGWIPKKNRATFKEGNTIKDSIEIVGILRMTEKRPPFVPANAPTKGAWYYRDINAMAKLSGTEPVYIELLQGYGTPNGPIGGQTRVKLRNEHLSYTLTWFTLSACTSYMWYRNFILKLPML